MTDAMDGLPLVSRFDSSSPHEVRLAPPVVIVTSPARPHRRTSRFTTAHVLIAVVVLGAGLRTTAMVAGRCLWIDEAMLALNLIERSPAQLFEPLDWNQGAPVGFLLLVKAVLAVIGPSEFGLRFVPFVGSLVGLGLFAWVTRRLLSAPGAILATVLFAASPYLISYSAECKQYATDATVSIGLFALSVGLLRRDAGRVKFAAIAVAGAASVWFAHPAAFVLGGIGTALLADALRARDRRRVLIASLTVCCWLASFAACYVLVLRHLGGNQYLRDYWAGHFLALPPQSLGDLTWIVGHFFTFFAFPGGLGGTEVRAGGIAALLFVLGIVGFWRERWPLAAALVLPAVFTLLASGLHQYPFAGRLLLFLVPFALIGVARGGWMVAVALHARLPIAAVIMLAVLVLAPSLETAQELRRPARSEQIDDVLDAVRADWQPGDRLYVYYGAKPAFLYYTRNGGFPENAIAFGTEARTNRGEYREQLAKLRGQSRVWLIFSHRHQDEELVIRVNAESMGRCLRTIPGTGAAAYLFDFSGQH